MAAQKVKYNGEEITPYQLFGIDEKATDEELRSAYRKACFKYHPDKNQHNPQLAEQNFKAIQKIWALIGTPQARARYDRELAIERGQYQPPQPATFVFSFRNGWFDTGTTNAVGGW